MFDVLVIGGGIGRLTAVRETARHRGTITLVETRPMFGGQLADAAGDACAAAEAAASFLHSTSSSPESFI